MAIRQKKCVCFSSRAILLVLISLCVALVTPKTLGRWRLPSEQKEAQTIATRKLNVQVSADGTVNETSEIAITVLSDVARADLAFIRRHYNPEITKYRLIRAETKTNNKIFQVPESAITDKPIHGGNAGFDQLRQTVLAVPRIEIGSEIRLQEGLEHKAVLKDFYSQRFYVGGYLGVESWDLQITSARPLFIKSNDPHALLEVKQAQKNGTYTLTMKTKKPAFVDLVEDGRYAEDLKRTWLEVSTETGWEKVFSGLARDWEGVLNGPLPAKIKKIIAEAKLHKGDLEQINTVLKAVHESVNYAGDWRSIKGQYIPNAFQDTIERGYGDCKDYSAITTRILRELGFRASPAFVFSNSNPREFTPALPNLRAFNHAIVHAQKENKEYWLDPTQWPTLAEVTPFGIDDRPALELKEEGSVLIAIPPPHPGENKIVHHMSIELAEKLLKIQRTIELEGRSYIQTKSLQKSVKSDVELVYSILTGILGIDRSDIQGLKLISLKENTGEGSRKFTISVQYSTENSLPKVGPYYVMAPPYRTYSPFDFNPANRVLWQFLPPAETVQSVLTFTNVKVGEYPLPNCDIKSPWQTAMRSTQIDKGNYVVIESLVRPANKIEAAEMQRPEFIKTKNLFLDCFKKPAVLMR